MATPRARAAIRTSSRCASSGLGVGCSRIAAGSTRSIVSYSRSKLTRRAAAIRPVKNRCSSATLPSCQFHMCPGRGGGRTAPVSRARIGPCSATSSSVSATSSGLSRAIREIDPHASRSTSAIRQRNSGWRSIGISDASWAQYSISRRSIFPVPWPAMRSRRVAVIRAEPGEHRHVMRAREHVDRVELEHAEALHQRRDLVDARRPRRPRPAEALRRERDPARARDAQLAGRWRLGRGHQSGVARLASNMSGRADG